MPTAEAVESSKPQQFQNAMMKVEVTEEWKGQEGHRGCFDEMFAALEEGRPAETDCLDNIKVLSDGFRSDRKRKNRQESDVVINWIHMK